jgi:thioesterase domain-containing protein
MDEQSPQSRRAALEARRARLTAEQRALLDQRLGGQVIAPAKPACLVQLSQGSGAPLFCVHPAGGDVLCFAALAQHLPGRSVLGLQSPGMAGEREPLTRLEEIAGHFVEVMRGVDPRGPYRVAGWSLGAHVAFEVCQQLTRAGAEVELLVLLDADPAAGAAAKQSLPGAEAFTDNASWLGGIAEYFERLWGQKIPASIERLKGLEPEAQLEAFVQALQAARGPLVPSVAQLRTVLSVYKANLRALIEYVPQIYPRPLTLLLSEGSADWAERARLGWAALSSKGIEVLTVPGDHYTLLAPPNVERMAAVIESLLERGRKEAR